MHCNMHTARRNVGWLGAVAGALVSPAAWAMTGAWVDTAADVLAVFVIIAVPIGGIYLFWKVHILPEIVAEKRHHPQKDAIKTLCILSLFFGGLLWPLAWLWAYSRPVMYKLAYGTDKHEDYFKEQAEHKETSGGEDVAALKAQIAKLEARVAKLSKKEGRGG
jgi:CBS domain containing-hemolysin-like protein